MRWSASVLVVLAAAGCAPAHLAVRPRGDLIVTEKDELETRLRVPESGAGGLDVIVHSPGASRRKSGKKKIVSVAVDVDVENRSETVIASFDPRSATLT